MATVVTITYVGDVRKCDESCDELWTEVVQEKVRRASRLNRKAQKHNQTAQKRAFDWKKNRRPGKRTQRVW